MALQVFNPPIGPSPGTDMPPVLNILKTEFGDGYTQDTPNGLNHIKETVSLKWDALTMEQMKEIYGFLVRHGGTRSFYFKPWGYDYVEKWTCSEFSRSNNEGLWSMNIKLVQSFTHEV